jgi:hypothetical protein
MTTETSKPKQHVDANLRRAYHSLHMAREHGSPDDCEFWAEAWAYEQQMARIYGYTDEMIQDAVKDLGGAL